MSETPENTITAADSQGRAKREAIYIGWVEAEIRNAVFETSIDDKGHTLADMCHTASLYAHRGEFKEAYDKFRENYKKYLNDATFSICGHLEAKNMQTHFDAMIEGAAGMAKVLGDPKNSWITERYIGATFRFDDKSYAEAVTKTIDEQIADYGFRLNEKAAKGSPKLDADAMIERLHKVLLETELSPGLPISKLVAATSGDIHQRFFRDACDDIMHYALLSTNAHVNAEWEIKKGLDSASRQLSNMRYELNHREGGNPLDDSTLSILDLDKSLLHIKDEKGFATLIKNALNEELAKEGLTLEAIKKSGLKTRQPAVYEYF